MPNERRWLSIRDFWTLRPTEVLENKKYLFETKDSQSETGHSLLVHAAATHGGIVNGNRKFYRPDFMAESTHTWLPGKNGYAKPVLIGHAEEGVVLGRVRDAKYVDESWKWSVDYPTIKDSIFYSKDVKRRTNLFKSVDWIVKNLQPQKDYVGLGYIDLGLSITNPDAIRKILDDEYLTVSVGSATDEAICSVCHQDWASDDKCEHKPGEKVDGQRMFLICGRFKYSEMSFVNFPADSAAFVNSKELKDSLEKMFFLGLPLFEQQTRIDSGLILTDSIFESDIQVTAEDTMQTSDITAIRAALESKELTAVQAFEFKDSVTSWDATSEDDLTTKRSLTSTINARIKKNEWVRDAAPVIDDNTQSEVAQVAVELTDAEAEAALLESEDAKKKGLPDFLKKKGEKDKCSCKDKDKCTCKDKEGNNAIAATFKGPKLSAGKTEAKAVSTTPLEKPDTKTEDRPKGKKKKKCAACTKDFESAEDNEDAENCEACSLTDDVKFVIEFLSKDEKTKDVDCDPGGDLVGIIKCLDKGYTAFPEGGRYSVRYAVRSLIDHWSADDEFKYWLKSLGNAGKLKDSVILSTDELKLKDEAVNALTTEVEAFDSRKKALQMSAASAIMDSKHSLATTVVLYRVTRGADGYTGLNTDQIQEKVTEFAKRSLVSLKDTVSDIFNELEWVKPTPAANLDNKADEPGVKVNDNMQVSESDSANPPAGTREHKVQDATAYSRALSYITNPAERTRYIADVKYGRIVL